MQIHQALGLFTCFAVMLAIYYGNGWNSRSLPFMSTHLLRANGTPYPVGKLFPGGELNELALAEYGVPKLSGTFAYSMLMANAAVGYAPSISKISPNRFIDWSPDSPLRVVLGQGYLPCIRECKKRKERRSSPCPHGQALQGGSILVVWSSTSD